MSDTSSLRPKPATTGLIGHPALSRKTTKKPANIKGTESVAAKTIISDSSSIISSSTRPVDKHTRYENTYRMDPKEGKHFQATNRVRDMVYGIMEAYLSDGGYDKDKSPTQTRDVAEMIKKRMRDMNLERYKYVVTVLLGEDRGQSLEVASRFLWSVNNDNYVTTTYRNGDLYATATVYAVYFE